MHCSSFTAHRPQAVWRFVWWFIAGVPLPTTPRQCSGALQEVPAHCAQVVWQPFHCLLPLGSVALRSRSSLPTAPRRVAVHCGSSTAYCPQAVWRCIVAVPLPTAPRQCGSALQEFHRPLPPGSVAVHCSSPTAPKQCGSALQEFHRPLPPGSVAVHCSSSTASCPQAMWQCIVAATLPTAPRQCGDALQEVPAHCPQAVWQHFHCLLPPGSVTLHSRSSLPTAPMQCGSAKQEFHCPLPPGSVSVHCPLPTSAVQHGTHSAVQCTAPSSAAQHTKY